MEELSLRTLQCVVVTPERAVLDQTVDFVALPMYDGELGVLPGRAPLIGRLGYGELRIRHDGQTEVYFVDGGFAQVRSNIVTVLTPRAIKGTDINVQAAEQLLATTHTAATGDQQVEHSKAQERARAQLRVAAHARGDAVAAAH
jgi:F-type H+-transporting ATPase subunit epsilon